MVIIDGLKACYVGVAACMGIAHPPPMPNVEIVPGAKFECGTYVTGETAYCAGLTEGRWIVAASGKLGVIQHEAIHYIVERRKLWHDAEDPGDGAHDGPWWGCDKKGAVPACAALWE